MRGPILRSLPSNVRPVDWIPVGVFLNGAMVSFIMADGQYPDSATRWYSTNRLRRGSRSPGKCRVVAERGCGIILCDVGLSSNT